MSLRQFISTLLVLSLLAALFPGVGMAENCRCRDHVCRMSHHDNDAGGGEAASTGERPCCASKKKADRRVTALPAPHEAITGMHPVPTGLRSAVDASISGHTVCCNDREAARTAAVDVAPLPPGSVSIPLLFAVAIDRFVYPAIGLDTRHAGGYKVESSPPFMADATRHTYLHTSSFLI